MNLKQTFKPWLCVCTASGEVVNIAIAANMRYDVKKFDPGLIPEQDYKFSTGQETDSI